MTVCSRSGGDVTLRCRHESVGLEKSQREFILPRGQSEPDLETRGTREVSGNTTPEGFISMLQISAFSFQ